MTEVPPHLTPGETIILRRLTLKYSRQLQHQAKHGTRTATTAAVLEASRTLELSLRKREVAASRQMRREMMYGR